MVKDGLLRKGSCFWAGDHGLGVFWGLYIPLTIRRIGSKGLRHWLESCFGVLNWRLLL